MVKSLRSNVWGDCTSYFSVCKKRTGSRCHFTPDSWLFPLFLPLLTCTHVARDSSGLLAPPFHAHGSGHRKEGTEVMHAWN